MKPKTIGVQVSPPKPKPCKTCGTCPTCGKVAAPVYPRPWNTDPRWNQQVASPPRPFQYWSYS